MTTLLPLYVYPLDEPAAWASAGRSGTDVWVVVNVHNGPGQGYDQAYGYATATLAAAGVPMLGYVDLDYGSRPVHRVHDDVSHWRLYPVGGVFFDRAPADRGALSWVAEACTPVRGRVVLNPGTRPDAGYAGLADMVCTFEGPWLRYRLTPAQPDWPNAAHLVYGVPAYELAAARRRLRSQVSHGLVTDLEYPLPYRGVPTYLADAAEVVHR
jgi:Spherulation-specific family 4